MELKTLLEYNIADSRRSEIATSHKKAKAEQKSGKLKFASTIKDLGNFANLLSFLITASIKKDLALISNSVLFSVPCFP